MDLTQSNNWVSGWHTHLLRTTLEKPYAWYLCSEADRLVTNQPFSELPHGLSEGTTQSLVQLGRTPGLP